MVRMMPRPAVGSREPVLFMTCVLRAVTALSVRSVIL